MNRNRLLSFWLCAALPLVATAAGPHQELHAVEAGNTTPEVAKPTASLPADSVFERPAVWNLQSCITYARQHNLQVRNAQIDYESAATDLKTAKAARYPSLSFGSNQGFTNGNTFNETNGRFVSNPQYTGTYSLSTDMVIYNGSRLHNTVKQRKINLEMNRLLVDKAQNDIEIAVTNAYLEVLYATESMKIDSAILETSTMQYEEGQARYDVGALNLSDLAQLKAQYGSDLYQLTVSRNQVRQATLALKQLLELDLDEEPDLHFPNIESVQITREVPSLHSVYYTALETMPEIKAAEEGIASAVLNEKVAKAGRLPSVTFNAAVGTGYYTSADFAFLNQLGNNINENISLGIRIPIYQRREAKSAVDKAVLQTRRSELDLQTRQKDLLATIENLHQNAVAAQERYKAAELQMDASQESYRLMQERYAAGLSTLVDMFSEKNNFLSATGEMLKAKYQAALSLCLLNFYQNQPISF